MSFIVYRHVFIMASGCTLLLQVSLFKKQAYRTIILYIQTDPKKDTFSAAVVGSPVK